MPMLGCVFGLIRWALGLALVVAIAGGAYLYVRSNPEKFRGGVEGAVDRVKESAEDLALATRVRAAVGLRDAFKNLDVHVSAERGVVTLRGRVPAEGLRTEVAAVAGAVPGVAQVVNFLEVDSRVSAPGGSAADARSVGEKLDDEALELKVRAAFELDRELKGVALTVTATRREVMLSSSSATEAQMKRAESVARSIEGVKTVTARRPE